MKRIAVKVAYLGKEFCGSQMQPGVRTVVNDILSDLQNITNLPREQFRLKMAGRTDRGVNALGNVAVFNTSFDNAEKLIRALNAVSNGIFYLAYAYVDDEFEPRHADLRTYRYILRADGHDIDKVKECSKLFIGEHDFKRFCKVDERSTFVNMQDISINEDDGNIIIQFCADHFLWNMIRRIVSAISSVGMGRSSLNDVKKALGGDDITFGIARPDGLFLADVFYKNVNFVNVLVSNKKVDEELFLLSLNKEFYTSLKR